MKKCIVLIFYLINICVCLPAIGNVHNNAEPLAPCAPGYNTLYVMNYSETCSVTGNGTTSGLMLFGAGQKFGPADSTDSFGLGNYQVYVPFAGMWGARNYICPTDTPAKCTIANATEYVDALKKVQLNSSQWIYTQAPNFGGAEPRTVNYSFTMCSTLVDTAGVAWGSGDPTSCADAKKLPSTSSYCYINYQEDLNVDMGILERSNIGTSAGTTTGVSKSIPVICIRDGQTDVNMQFKYDSLSVNGNEVIRSNITGLGIAVLYNGKALSPADKIPMHFQLGYSYIDLTFEAVRDPTLPLGNLATGSFKSQAVLILTEL